MTLHADTIHDLRPSTVDTLYVLPRHYDVQSLAVMCRDAAVDFVNASPAFGKLDLVLWLTGVYDSLAGHAIARSNGAQEGPPSSGANLYLSADVHFVEASIDHARQNVLATLRHVSTSGEIANFAYTSLARGHVIACEDRRGNEGFTPVDLRELSLEERLLALLAVAYLTSPEEFEQLTVCEHCAHVDFGDNACVHHIRRWSGIQVRGTSSWPPPAKQQQAA